MSRARSDRDDPARHGQKSKDHLTPERRSQVMAMIRRRDTGPEVLLRRALWRAGMRGWRTDAGNLPGRPDVAFSRWKVAVFVDGLLWHGHPSKYPANLTDAWIAKITRNVQRDRAADRELAEMGWAVVRLWDADVRRHPIAAVRHIEALVKLRGRSAS